MKDNGGSAFPCSMRRDENYMDEGGFGRVRTVTLQEGGMSLRDYFAAKVVQGIISSPNTRITGAPNREQDADPALAQRAYEIADVMIAERNK
jgi:hypothetical protein